MSSNAGDESARELHLTTAALKDARARIRQLEFEMGKLRRELGAAQAARDLAGVHVSAMLKDLREAIAASRQGPQGSSPVTQNAGKSPQLRSCAWIRRGLESALTGRVNTNRASSNT
ncbi:hypothetical protein [Paraburkholderia youngii]|uniref:hypothetical protein n=1 Tax=Paraburkholderia youngii TaxID=2782701 RepID=UPI003D1F8B6E